jgi:chromosome segregation and condensation protein ScpB
VAIEPGSALSAGEMRVLLYVCYFQPINFGKLARLLGKRSAAM